MDGKLPFLDTFLHHKSNGSLNISIYRKATHTPIPELHLSPLKPSERGYGLLLFPLCMTRETIQAEEDHLRGLLEGNGYPEAFVEMDSKPHTYSERATEEPRATAFMHPQYRRPEQRVRLACRR